MQTAETQCAGWRRHCLGDWRPLYDFYCVGFDSRTGTSSGSEFPPLARVSPAAARLARLGIRSVDSVIHNQRCGRGAVLARLRATSTGGGVRQRGVAAKWNYVVLIPLEFRLVRHAGAAADRIAPAVDRAATEEHVGWDNDSRSIQRCWVYGRHQRSRQVVGYDRLGGLPRPSGTRTNKALCVEMSVLGHFDSSLQVSTPGASAIRKPCGSLAISLTIPSGAEASGAVSTVIDRTLTDDQPSVCVLENGFDPNRAGARCVSFGGPIRARIASRRWSKCFEKVFPCLLPTVIDGRHNGVALLLGEYRRETRCAADRVLVDVCETPRRGRVLRSPEHEPTPPASVVLFGI